jgi:hypothetical protein
MLANRRTPMNRLNGSPSSAGNDLTPVLEGETPAARRLAAELALTHYLTTDDVAGLLRCSRRAVHELRRTGSIPHRRAPPARRCLFLAAEIQSWLDGAPLESVELQRGGRIVRPINPDRPQAKREPQR